MQRNGVLARFATFMVAQKEKGPFLDTVKELVSIESGRADRGGLDRLSALIADRLRGLVGKVTLIRLGTATLIAALSLCASTQAEKRKPSGSEEILIEGPRRTPDNYFSGWHEYQSEHFLVDSDLLTFLVAKLIRKLETLRAVELRSLVAQPIAFPGRVRVIAASASPRLDELARDQYFVGSGPRCQLARLSCLQLDPSRLHDLTIHCGQDLFYAANYFLSRLGEPTIVLPIAGLDVNSEVVAHEIAHHLASVLFLNPPPWFREGFAAFLQTVGSYPLENPPATGSHIQIGERTIRGAVGLVPPGFVAALCSDWVSAKELLAWQGEEAPGQRGRYHSQSWLLYHWLWNERSKQLSNFESRLALAEDPATAWREALPEFSPDKAGALQSLDDALERHRRRPKAAYYRVEADADVSYTTQPLLPTEVHMLWLDARYSAQVRHKESPDWLRSELQNLLLEEPLEPMALAWRGELEQTSTLEPLRRATAKWPANWRAWLFLGEAADAAEEKGAAYQMAVKLNPDSALAQERMALFLATSGRPQEGLSFAQQAVLLAPWDARATATLSVVDAALGQCPEALAMYQRALSLSSSANAPKQLVEVDRRCGAARPQ